MKRRFLIAGAITLLVAAAVFILWLTQPFDHFFDSITTSRHYIDDSNEIILDFKGADISVYEWGKDYIEVTYDNVFGGKRELDISIEGNVLTLNSDLDFSGYRHLDVRVPKTVICSIYAERIDSKSGTFKEVRADSASLRYCCMVDGFVSEGGELEIRESKLIGNSIIKNEAVEIRDCDSGTVVLSPAGKQVYAKLRELTGDFVKVDALNCGDMNVELKDTSLNRFAVDYNGESGSLVIFSSEIGGVENNSKIQIDYKKNVLN